MAAELAPLDYSEKNAGSDRKTRNQAILRLLKDWLDDKSGYDEQTWPALKEAIERDRLSSRPRFRE